MWEAEIFSCGAEIFLWEAEIFLWEAEIFLWEAVISTDGSLGLFEQQAVNFCEHGNEMQTIANRNICIVRFFALSLQHE